MVDPATTRLVLHWALFLLLGLALIFLNLLPLSTDPESWPGPDLIYCLAAAWMMRRPSYVPVLLLAFMLLLSDLLFLKPVGLWTAIGLLGFEFLRGQALQPGDLPITSEIVLVGCTFAVMTGIYAGVLAVFDEATALAHDMALHVLFTVLAYPFVVLFTHFVLQVRYIRPGGYSGFGDS